MYRKIKINRLYRKFNKNNYTCGMREFNIVHKRPGVKAKMVSINQLDKYIGKKNSETVKKKLDSFRTQNIKIKFRKEGIIYGYRL